MRAVTRAPYVSTDRKTCRHCEPPFQKWQELVNHDKGGWQSDFDFLSQNRWKKKNCGLPRRFAERNLSPTIKAKRQNGSQ